MRSLPGNSCRIKVCFRSSIALLNSCTSIPSKRLIQTGWKASERRSLSMIDASIIDNDLLSLAFQPVWINRLLGMLVHEFKSAIDDRKQTLILQEFPGSERMIYADG